MKQRIFAILLSLTMMFTLVPTAWAVENEESSQEAVVEEPETELIEGLQARINALPGADALAEMSAEEQAGVYAEVCAIYDAIDELTDEEAEALDVSALEDVAAFFTQQIMPLDGEPTGKMYGNCGATGNESNVNWKLTQNSADSENPTYTLTISGSGAMADYNSNIGNPNATQPWRTSQTGINVEKITKIVVKQGVTKIGDFAFNGITNVTEYNIAATVTDIGGWGFDTSSVEHFYLNGNPNYTVDSDGVLLTADGKTLIAYPGGAAPRASYTIPGTVTTVASGAFVGCDAAKLVIPSTVTTLPSWSFNGGTIREIVCNATMETLPDSVFPNIETLEKISFGSTIKTLPKQAMFGCKKLCDVTLPDGLTSIGDQAFMDCSALSCIKFPASLRSIGYQAFIRCTALSGIEFPEGLTTIGDQAFFRCSALTALVFPNSLTTIGGNAFNGCTGLKYVVHGSGIDNIGGSAFSGCTSLKVIDIHRAVNIGDVWDNGVSSIPDRDPTLNHACESTLKKVFYYMRSEDQAKSAKGNIEWGNGQAGGGNTTNTYYVLTAKDAVPDYTGQTITPKRAGYTFDKWKAVTVSQGSPDVKNVYTDANSWSLASPTVTVSADKTSIVSSTGTATLTATAQHEAKGVIYEYQWYTGTPDSGTQITGETSPTYQVNNLTSGTTYYCKVTAVNGNDKSEAATSNTVTISVANAEGHVAITNDKTTATYGDEPFTFTYTASGTATVKSSDTSVATVSDDNGTVTVTIVGAGSATISVSSSASAANTAASAEFTLTVAKATQSMSYAATKVDKYIGDAAFTNELTKTTVFGTVTYASSDTAVATVDAQSGEVTIVGTGTATITATAAGDRTNYDAAAASYTLTVSRRSSGGSSSSSGSSYAVSAPSTKNGDVTVSPKNASKGDRVTVTVKPDSGYEVGSVTVLDSKGNELKLTDKGNGKYTFTMPGGKVEVKATFVKAGETSPFVDVPTDSYYFDAVKWAQKLGITNGKTDALFGSSDPCTRGQIVTFLWRAAGSPAPKGTAKVPTDVLPGSYCYDAVAWAIENGVTNGFADGTFGVNSTCTRGQSVTFLYRALGTAPTTVNGFTDVAAGDFYAEAVAWAVENGVTNGTTDSTFSPSNGCTRAQIVTFLYRAKN